MINDLWFCVAICRNRIFFAEVKSGVRKKEVSVLYLVTYDLNKPGQNYEGLFASIQKLGPCIRPLKSAWVVKTTLTIAQIKDALLVQMDGTDGLIIIPIVKLGIGGQLPQAAWDWINQRL